MVLYGSGREEIPFQYLNERGKKMLREHAFEGIVNNLERRYNETESPTVREELAKYSMAVPARNAKARVCAEKRAMCASPTIPFTNSVPCR